MGYKICEIDVERKFCEEMSLDALTSAIPLSDIEAVLTQARATERRHRRLAMIAIVRVPSVNGILLANPMPSKFKGFHLSDPDKTTKGIIHEIESAGRSAM